MLQKILTINERMLNKSGSGRYKRRSISTNKRRTQGLRVHQTALNIPVALKQPCRKYPDNYGLKRSK